MIKFILIILVFMISFISLNRWVFCEIPLFSFEKTEKGFRITLNIDDF